jgi:sepiapterin reductase
MDKYQFNQVILTGGRGGFGNAILKQLKAKRIIVLTRKNSIDIYTDNISTVTINYLDPEAKTKLLSILDLIDTSEQLLFISNAGTLSSLSRVGLVSFEDINESFMINCTIPFYITKLLLQKIEPHLLTICNVSSLCAIQPCENMGLYCSSKAAREMFFKTATLEYPKLRVLNYAPGPMDTDMQTRIRQEMNGCASKDRFIALHQSGGLVDPNESAKLMLELLMNNKFINASHVDFYDLH